VNAMVTRGARGAVLLADGRSYRFTPPAVLARNAVGSGDACMAGLAAGVVAGLAAEAYGRLAVAAGAANAAHGFGRCSREEIDAFVGLVGCLRE
jgi:tagatose 6-phosphate kinase